MPERPRRYVVGPECSAGVVTERRIAAPPILLGVGEQREEVREVARVASQYRRKRAQLLLRENALERRVDNVGVLGAAVLPEMLAERTSGLVDELESLPEDVSRI